MFLNVTFMSSASVSFRGPTREHTNLMQNFPCILVNIYGSHGYQSDVKILLKCSWILFEPSFQILIFNLKNVLFFFLFECYCVFKILAATCYYKGSNRFQMNNGHFF
jgi:hypothetical protein